MCANAVRCGLTCDGVIMVRSMGEGLQQVRLVLKGVADLSFKVLEARDKVVECALCVRVFQHTAGWDLQPAITQVIGCGLTALHCCPSYGSSLQWQHLYNEFAWANFKNLNESSILDCNLHF